jgi:hypothetical protein
MKRSKLLRSSIVAVALAAAGLGADAVIARADVITLDVTADATPSRMSACSVGGCALGGKFVIDNTAGTVVSEDVTATGFVPSAKSHKRRLWQIPDISGKNTAGRSRSGRGAQWNSRCRDLLSEFSFADGL